MSNRRRKSSSYKRRKEFRSAAQIVIATEGELTEKQYFSMFNNTRVRVEVIPSEGGKSAPKHVIARLDKYREKYQIGEEDTLWLMVDVDRWQTLAEDVEEAFEKEYFLAVSNPCFECWLFLHHGDINEEKISCEEIRYRLKRLLGSFNKTNLDVSKFKDREMEAVRRAKKLDVNPGERWPLKTGTHVYKVIEKIFETSGSRIG